MSGQADWRPLASPQTLAARAQLYRLLREYFYSRDILEVETPLLSTTTTSDPFIQSFSLQFAGKPHYLHTSPELYMKRLLADGIGDIYQLAKVFRREEKGGRHLPEFSMLEWYRLKRDEHRLMAEVENLLTSLLSTFRDYRLKSTKLSYRECFQKYCDLDPHKATVQDLKAVAAHFGLKDVLDKEAEKDRWLDLLMACVIDSRLSGSLEQPQLCFIYNYPASQSAMARTGRDDQGALIARRFEAYLGGMELANGYYELTNSDEQLKRIQSEQKYRQQHKLDDIPADPAFIRALQQGLPECSGVAMGLDRLLMVLLQKSAIHDVVSFTGTSL